MRRGGRTSAGRSSRDTGAFLRRTATVLRTLLVAPISRTIRRIPTEVSLGLSEGLPVASAATFDSVLTVPKSMLVRRMGALAPDRHRELCEAFAAALDC
jgi:mRNA interferase MazF